MHEGVRIIEGLLYFLSSRLIHVCFTLILFLSSWYAFISQSYSPYTYNYRQLKLGNFLPYFFFNPQHYPCIILSHVFSGCISHTFSYFFVVSSESAIVSWTDLISIESSSSPQICTTYAEGFYFLILAFS